jgi:hypothetical protein
MGRTKRKTDDVGLNLVLTRDRLLTYLFNNGLDPARVPSAPDFSLPPDARERAQWSRAASAAMVHMMLHGLPGQVRGSAGEWEDLPRCAARKCKVGAVSCALFELCEFWGDQDHRKLSAAVTELLTHITNLDPDVLAAIDHSASNMLSRIKEPQNRLLARARELEVEGDHEGATELLQAAGKGARIIAPQRLALERSIAAAQMARAMATNLAPVLSMIGTRRGSKPTTLPRRGRGRPKQTLRTALLQHLKRGGLSYRDMGVLVVGAASSRQAAGIKNQLHQATLGRDLRSIRPFED